MKLKMRLLFWVGLGLFALSFVLPSFMGGMHGSSETLGYECFLFSLETFSFLFQNETTLSDYLFPMYIIACHLCLITSIILFLSNSKFRVLALIIGVIGAASNLYWLAAGLVSDGVSDLLVGYYLWAGASILIYNVAIWKAFAKKARMGYVPKSKLSGAIDAI
jgi:hypothetical protein